MRKGLLIVLALFPAAAPAQDLTPEQQRTFTNKAPEVFKPCSGAWGRQGYTNVYLPAAKTGMVHAALDAAAKNVTSRAKKIKKAGTQ